MERQLSSAWTFIFKYPFPVVWITGFGLGTLSLFADPADVIYNGVRGAAPPDLKWTLLVAWITGSAFILWIARPLKRVRVTEGALLVSNYWREVRVPFGAVDEVRQNRWINVRPISVRLSIDVPGVGSHFTFLPPTRFRFAVWREDREVEELRDLIGL